jgi:hypothetical protein
MYVSWEQIHVSKDMIPPLSCVVFIYSALEAGAGTFSPNLMRTDRMPD